tara:strand:+ start:613 stop:846 length:234 start_codon:yes stop_codon:yes gene_type:complete
MDRINTMNIDKFVEAFTFIGKGPCQEFNCPRQQECAEEKVECKAFRYWVNNDSYDTMRKGKKTSIAIDMERLLKPIE